MKVVFFGTDDFSAEHLRFLLENGVDIGLVITQPDRPKGRGKKLLPTPVKLVASEFKVEVIQPESLKNSELEKVIKNYDVGIVVSFGQIIPQRILDAPKHGLFNLHPSLLPRWRGASPIQRALEAGDKETGVTIFKIVMKLDSGPIALQKKVKVGEYETYGILSERLLKLGQTMLLEFLDLLKKGKINLKPQSNEGVTYAKKISKDDLKIDFYEEALKVKNKIRAYDPKPGAFCFLKKERVKLFGVKAVISGNDIPGKVLNISKEGAVISCGKDSVLIERIQFPGKKPMNFVDAQNGRLLSVGDVFR